MKYIIALLICLASITCLQATPEKIYLDEKEMDMSQGTIRIHIGHNIWIQANTIHKDIHGIFALENEINQESDKEYQRTWKCPYCYRHWPIGEKCGNKDCPSKYM